MDNSTLNSQSSKRQILLCISGSIAAYKMADVTSQLVSLGHEVVCVLTESAAQFVTPTALETLSRNRVHGALFGSDVSGTEHIRLARWADTLVFAPATANLIAKLSLGLADDLVTTIALASEAPWIVAPAMNTVMWNQTVVQAHIQSLKMRGATFVEPSEGSLACGEVGIGKLATPEQIVVQILSHSVPSNLTRCQDLEGVSVLITAGPTTSSIDAVRYLTNHSTGKMGAAMAEEALARGAEVYYILGIDKGVIRPHAPKGQETRLKITEVRTAGQMCEAALQVLPRVNGVIAAAAVLDYQVLQTAPNKLKRSTKSETLTLLPAVDVLQELRKLGNDDQWFFGFAAETDHLESNAEEKLKRKRLDYLFANPIAQEGNRLSTGFGTETNGGTLHRPGHKPRILPLQTKIELARELWDVVVCDRRTQHA